MEVPQTTPELAVLYHSNMVLILDAQRSEHSYINPLIPVHEVGIRLSIPSVLQRQQLVPYGRPAVYHHDDHECHPYYRRLLPSCKRHFPFVDVKMTEFRDCQNSDNKKEIFKLLSELQKETNDLSEFRKGYIGDREELDRPFHELIVYVAVRKHLISFQVFDIRTI